MIRCWLFGHMWGRAKMKLGATHITYDGPARMVEYHYKCERCHEAKVEIPALED